MANKPQIDGMASAAKGEVFFNAIWPSTGGRHTVRIL
jgi:hypothetical protein